MRTGDFKDDDEQIRKYYRVQVKRSEQRSFKVKLRHNYVQGHHFVIPVNSRGVNYIYI